MGWAIDAATTMRSGSDHGSGRRGCAARGGGHRSLRSDAWAGPARETELPRGLDAADTVIVVHDTARRLCLRIRDGWVTSELVVPPAGFQPVNAPDDELAEFHIEPRPPAGTTERTRWDDWMSRYKGTYAPELCATADGETFSSPAVAAPSGGAGLAHGGGMAPYKAKYNWSGYENTSGSASTFDAVHGNWTQWTPRNCNCTGTTDEVTWVGLGGDGNGSLLRDGTRYYGSQSYAWYEYLHLCSGTNCNISIQSAQSVPYGTTMHEYINERPLHCSTGCYYPLTNYGSPMGWADAQYHTPGGTWQNFTNTSFTDLEMSNDSNWYGSPCGASAHIFAYGVGAYLDSFNNYWCRPS